jgi:type VI secretion system protein ImpL
VKAIIRNPWFIGGVGVTIVALLIFFVGPLIGIGESRPLGSLLARVLTILVVILGWVGYRLFKHFRAKKAADEISSGIVDVDSSGAADEASSAEEVATLKARFEEAMTVLKKTGSGKATNLYELPWYVIIGPPGAGKTTALVNSGLRFPLSDKFGENALRGVGGTRNCDWWFTEEAILLDTAGRYTTQDSQASVDRAAWEGFLDLLRKYRKRRPINGVLVAFSVTDFMDPVQRQQHASAIKNRIQELDDFFGMRFPVYVLITKCDLMSGFVDYFEDLGASEREQVWGLTLPLDETGQQTGIGDRVGQELDALFARIDERVLTRLNQERDVKRRSLIYGFPQQIHSLKAPLVELIDDIFQSSRFEDAAMLRGVYFSSGTQEGTPIDRVMASVSRTFGLDEQALPSHSGQGRSYFLTRLLQQVVFQEAGIAGTNRSVERRRAWLQRAAYAGVFVVTGLLVAGWTLSYFGNQGLLEEVERRARVAETSLSEVPSNRREPEVTLEALNAVAVIVPPEDEIGLSFTGLGLDQRSALTEQADAAYRRALTNQLLPRVMLRLEQQIKQTRQPLDFTYEALKTYLRLAFEKRYDAEEIGAWVSLDWSGRLPREVGQDGFESLIGHLTNLVEERPVQLPLPLDDGLVRQARQRLMRVPMEERVYARLKGANIAEGLPGFTLFERAGPEALEVFVRDSGRSLNDGIPPFFTRKGFEKVFSAADSYQLVQELSSETWVLRDEVDLGDAQDIAALVTSLRELYFQDYINAYQDLIYDVELAPFKDAREAARILNILARPTDSPLTSLIGEVSKETNFSGGGAQDGGDEAVEGDDAFAAQRERLQKLLGGQQEQVTDRYQARSYTNIVEEEFSEFHTLNGSGDAGNSPMGHLLSLLRELADFMMLVSREETADGVPQHVVERGQSIIQQIQFAAERQNVPMLEALLVAAANSVNNIASGGVATNIESQWQSGALQLCRQAIEGRYPVSKTAESEIRLEDFGRFFGFGGEADKFFESYLSDKIDSSRRPWRAAATRGVALSLDAIAQFERAISIRDTFFRGDSTPYAGFELTPVSMDPSVTQFSLTIDGQSTQYFHGPRVPQSFDWPGPDGVGEVRMEMSPGNGTPMRAVRGPWAWFRVLDASQMSPGSRPEHFEVVFELGGRTATYELVARSAYNPFRLQDLSQFRCPQRLTQ